MPWEPPAQAFQGKAWEPPPEAFGAKSAPGRKPGAAEATEAYLAANEPSVLTRALMNLRRSAKSYVRNAPAMSGGPVSGPALTMGDDKVIRGADGNEFKMGPGETWEDIKNLAGSAGRLVRHPIDTITESFAEDPINTAAMVAMGVRQVAPPVIRGAQAAPSGVRGAITEATTKKPLPSVSFGSRRLALNKEVPGIVADSLEGAGAGATAGMILPGVTTQGGAAAGAVVGAGKNLVRGYRKGTAAFRLAQEQARRGPRTPLSAEPSSVPRGTPTSTTPPPPAAPGALPSGRRPGGIQNQQKSAPGAPTAPQIDPMDAIAAEIGYKKPYSKLTASQQMEVKIAQKVAEQSAAKADPFIRQEDGMPLMRKGTEAPDVPKAPVNTSMADALQRAKVEVPAAPARPTPGRPMPGKPGGEVRENPLEQPELYNAIVGKSDVAQFAKDQGVSVSEAAQVMADRGTLALSKSAMMKSLHGHFPGHQALSDAALRRFGVQSTKELTESQWGTWYDEIRTKELKAAADAAFKASQKQARAAAKNPDLAQQLQDSIDIVKAKRPVANPEAIPAAKITEQIERLSKKPNLTMGETNLLRQLRDEVKKRGTK